MEIIFCDVKITVLGDVIPAQAGGLDDPSWGEWFEVESVLAGEVEISGLLSEKQIEEIGVLALDAYHDR